MPLLAWYRGNQCSKDLEHSCRIYHPWSRLCCWRTSWANKVCLVCCLVAVAVDFDEVLLFEVSKLEVRTVGGGSLVFLPLIFPFFSAKNKLVRVALKML